MASSGLWILLSVMALCALMHVAEARRDQWALRHKEERDREFRGPLAYESESGRRSGRREESKGMEESESESGSGRREPESERRESEESERRESEESERGKSEESESRGKSEESETGESEESESESESESEGSAEKVASFLDQNGLPRGLFPETITAYKTEEETGMFEIALKEPCYAKLEGEVWYDKIVRGKIGPSRIDDISGIRIKQMFVWLPVTGIHVDDPDSGFVYFEVGPLSTKISVLAFQEPPQCSAESTS